MKSSSLLTAGEEFYITLRAINSSWNESASELLSPLQLTPSLYEVLRMIQANPRITATEMKKRQRIAGASMSALLRTLLDAEFIHRTADTKDTRRLFITLTKQGRNRLKVAEDTLRDFFSRTRLQASALNTATQALRALSLHHDITS